MKKCGREAAFFLFLTGHLLAIFFEIQYNIKNRRGIPR